MTQNEALTIMMQGENVFLTGAAGSGKTYVLNQFIKWAKGEDKEVAVTASTGIAATHMSGMTVHSWSGIGIKNHLSKTDLEKMQKNTQLRLRYLRTDVLIIDEVSMISAEILDLLDQAARYIRKSDWSFGGMQVILCGDFFQLPPISRDKEVRFAFESQAWQSAEPRVCYLEEQHRQEDNTLLNLLTAMRGNQVGSGYVDLLKARTDVVLDDLYRPTELFTHNVDVDALNQKRLDQMDGKSKSFHMEATGKKKFITAIKKGCLAPEEFQMKVGAVVMFVKNNFAQKYVNGTIGEIVEITKEGYPIVQTRDGREIVVRPESWSIKDGDDVLAEVMQLPLRLAWGITIHKSQGMSLDSAIIDLRKCFLPGMGYVALSRVKTLEGLSLKGFNQMSLQVDPKILAFDQKIREC